MKTVMEKVFDTPVSLTDARTGKRVRVQALPAGCALVATPEPILGSPTSAAI